jgi:ComF family protein
VVDVKTVDENGLGSEAVGTRAARMVRVLARRVGDVIVPPVCLSCHGALADHDTLCARCWSQIDFIRAPLCDRLGIPLNFDTGGAMVSAAALADPPVYDRARAVAVFSSGIQELIHGLKYADRHDGRRLFGRWLVAAGAELLADADVLVPVPLNRWRLLSRRFNQSAILAQEVARLSGVDYAPMALRRVRATVSQVGLTVDARKRNVTGAFAVPARCVGQVAGQRIVLVDDVITTGATVQAAARVLKAAGAARVDVLALAVVAV